MSSSIDGDGEENKGGSYYTVDVEEEREDRHEPQREAAKSNEPKVSRSSQERHQKLAIVIGKSSGVWFR
jgi:hypothetical protein